MEEKLVKTKGSLEDSTSRLIRRTADSAKVRRENARSLARSERGTWTKESSHLSRDGKEGEVKRTTEEASVVGRKTSYEQQRGCKSGERRLLILLPQVVSPAIISRLGGRFISDHYYGTTMHVIGKDILL